MMEHVSYRGMNQACEKALAAIKMSDDKGKKIKLKGRCGKRKWILTYKEGRIDSIWCKKQRNKEPNAYYLFEEADIRYLSPEES